MAAPRLLLDQAKQAVDILRGLGDAPIVACGAGYAIFFPGRPAIHLGADMGLASDGEDTFPDLLEILASGGDPAGLPSLYLPGRPAGPGSTDLAPLENPAKVLGSMKPVRTLRSASR